MANLPIDPDFNRFIDPIGPEGLNAVPEVEEDH
jgi:hypothetical protein